MKNKTISLLLICSIIFNMVGFSGCSKAGEKPADKSIQLPEHITGTVSEENLIVSQDRVSFTIEEGSVLKNTDVEITLKKDLPPFIVEDEEIILTAYDFSVSGDDPLGVMTLEIPFTALDNEVFAAYYNSESGEWEPVVFEYDIERKCAVIYTTHLSSYGLFTVKNENTRNALLAYTYDLELTDRNVNEAIRMLENAFEDPDTFYADSFDLISNSVSIHSSVTTNLVDAASGLSSYVPTFSEGLKDNVTRFGYLLTGIEVVDAFMNDDKPGAVWKMFDAAVGFNMDKITSLSGTASMAAGLFSVGLINYALNQFISTALQGRTDMYERAYNLYYKEKGRSTAEWVHLIRVMVETGKDPEETGMAISAEIKRYVNQFWEDELTVAEYGKDANPEAWSSGSLGGLNDSIKKEISDYSQMTIERIVNNILHRIQTENKINMQAEMRKELFAFQKKMNSIVTITVKDSKAENEPSYFSGAVLRFTELPSSIEDPEKWECKITEKGAARIQFRVLAHLLAGGPRKMEIVKKSGDKEDVMIRFNAKFSLPESKLDLADLYPKSDYPKNIGGTYTVSMYNTTTEKTIDDLTLNVTVTQEVSDGCYADFYLENNGSVYLNGNYFYRYATGKVNYALGDMSFSGDENNVSFKFDAYDNQKKVWGAFTGHK
ncbi:MAG: hypothetical protein GX892_15870 [Thermoanaerobacteraceae bacterium]|nr:hypothetical protein [Thermoanaerobacteraceae bacterium]